MNYVCVYECVFNMNHWSYHKHVSFIKSEFLLIFTYIFFSSRNRASLSIIGKHFSLVFFVIVSPIPLHRPYTFLLLLKSIVYFQALHLHLHLHIHFIIVISHTLESTDVSARASNGFCALVHRTFHTSCHPCTIAFIYSFFDLFGIIFIITIYLIYTLHFICIFVRSFIRLFVCFICSETALHWFALLHSLHVLINHILYLYFSDCDNDRWHDGNAFSALQFVTINKPNKFISLL